MSKSKSTKGSIKQDVKGFVLETPNPDGTILDKTSADELSSFLKTGHYGLNISKKDLLAKKFKTVEQIATFIMEKMDEGK